MEQRLLSLSTLLRAGLGVVVFSAACAGRPGLGPSASTPSESVSGSPHGDGASATPASASDAPNEGTRENSSDPSKSHLATTHGAQTPSEEATTELPRGTLVLHVGDSFAGSLGVPLGHRLKERGVRSVLEFQTSSYVPTWASGKELPSYVARYNPDLVIVTLGANEFELANPAQRAGAVRRLVQRIGARPCVWVSPPRWKQDTGILAVIQANVKPCRYLDSDTVVHELARKQDKIHPSDPARELWADAVLAWLAHERQTSGDKPWALKEGTP